MSALWTTVTVAACCVGLALFASWQRRGRHENLGAVSDHWIAEHRFGAAEDSRR
jgi:hypothetical protein